MNTKQTIEIYHINPNCLGSKYCEPHSEKGEVYYSSKNVRKLIEDGVRGLFEFMIDKETEGRKFNAKPLNKTIYDLKIMYLGQYLSNLKEEE